MLIGNMAGAGFGAYAAAYSSDSIYGVGGKKNYNGRSRLPGNVSDGFAFRNCPAFLAGDDRFPKMSCESSESLDFVDRCNMGCV